MSPEGNKAKLSQVSKSGRAQPSRRLRVAASLILVAAVAVGVPPVRQAVLRGLGNLLVVADPIQPADVGVITERGDGLEIEASQLYHRGVIPRVVVLVPAPTAVDQAYLKLGVHREDVVLTALHQLGVPDGTVTRVDAGEGGTTDSTLALVSWVRDHPGRVLVIVSPTHARRHRRALMRVWPDGVPSPRLTVPHDNLFHVEDWWRSRRTRREGLFELQKLAWDYVSHPWPGR